MNRKQLLDFQKKAMMECNEIFHYLTYLLEAYTAILAVFAMANIQGFLFYGLFATSVFFTIQCWHRQYIWVWDDGRKVRFIYYMHYLPINWREYFKIRVEMFIKFYMKTSGLMAVMGLMGYYLFHRTLDIHMFSDIGKEFFCITVIFLGISFFELERERKDCCFALHSSLLSFFSDLF